MPRFTRSAILACAIVAALAACTTGPPETVFSGRFSPDSPIRLVNQTIPEGRYRIGYSLEVLFDPTRQGSTLTCTLVDTSGRIAGFDSMGSTVIAGGWNRLAAQSVYDLPELTLGIRCAPGGRELLTAVFRKVTLTATPIG